MATEITDAMIAEWRALCEKATPGPCVSINGVVFANNQSAVANCKTQWANDDDEDGLILDEIRAGDDARFYSAARTALPALLDENERLRKIDAVWTSLTDAMRLVIPHTDKPDRIVDALLDAVKENQRLRKERDEYAERLAREVMRIASGRRDPQVIEEAKRRLAEGGGA